MKKIFAALSAFELALLMQSAKVLADSPKDSASSELVSDAVDSSTLLLTQHDRIYDIAAELIAVLERNPHLHSKDLEMVFKEWKRNQTETAVNAPKKVARRASLN